MLRSDPTDVRPRLTERQNQALEFIRSFMRSYHRPPTLKEIGRALGVRSTNAVTKLLLSLERKGYIRREQHAARGIELVEGEYPVHGPDRAMPGLIVIGRTKSAEPEHLRQRPAGLLHVDPFFIRGIPDPEACLIARAGDDGMSGEGIRKGDFVVVHEMPWRALRTGDLAAALVRDELHVRRFSYAGEHFHLRPSDRTYAEDVFAPEDPACHIIGRVVAVLRRL